MDKYDIYVYTPIYDKLHIYTVLLSSIHNFASYMYHYQNYKLD